MPCSRTDMSDGRRATDLVRDRVASGTVQPEHITKNENHQRKRDIRVGGHCHLLELDHSLTVEDK